MIIAVVSIVSGGKQTQVIPPSFAAIVPNPINGGLRHNRQVRALLKMLCRAIQAVDERSAHRTSLLHIRTEHKAINRQRIQIAPKETGKPDALFKNIVLGNLAAERQLTPHNSERPSRPVCADRAQPQAVPVSGGPVSGRLARKSHLMGAHRHAPQYNFTSAGDAPVRRVSLGTKARNPLSSRYNTRIRRNLTMNKWATWNRTAAMACGIFASSLS